MAVYSHSRLSSFEQCRLKYKFKYIDKLKPDILTTIEGYLGSKVHSALEHLYSNSMKGIILPLDNVITYYAESWQKDFSNDIKIVKKDLDAEYYFNKGIKFIIDYYSTHSPFKDNTIALEKKIFIRLDNSDKYMILGYIDRLVHNKDTGIFEIHDYKTSGTIKTQEELDKDRQLALYSIAIRDSYENVNDVHLVWHFLDFNKRILSKRTIENLKQLKNEIILLIDAIESATSFDPNPSILCNWCEFRSYCPIIASGLNPYINQTNGNNGEYERE